MINAERKPVLGLAHWKVSTKTFERFLRKYMKSDKPLKGWLQHGVTILSYLSVDNSLNFLGDQNNAAILKLIPCLLKPHFSCTFFHFFVKNIPNVKVPKMENNSQMKRLVNFATDKYKFMSLVEESSNLRSVTTPFFNTMLWQSHSKAALQTDSFWIMHVIILSSFRFWPLILYHLKTLTRRENFAITVLLICSAKQGKLDMKN